MRLESPWIPRLANAAGPVSQRLVAALSEDILSGCLASGDRLPAQRDLAWRLGISVGSVTKSYSVLERRGLVRSEKGRGTFVAVHHARRDPTINLSVNIPPPLLSRRFLARSLMGVARKVDSDQLNLYAPNYGHIEHRLSISGWLARFGIVADPERLVLTGGAQQALALAFRMTCGRDGIVLTEQLTYPGAISLCRHLGIGMRGIEIDREGMVPSSLEQALGDISQTRRRVVYVTPCIHNPTAATMSLARRKEILEVCRRHDSIVIEDGVYMADVGQEKPLVVLEPERCLFVGSLSKTISPGVRVGMLLLSPALVSDADAVLDAVPFTPSPLSCLAVEDWLSTGAIEELRAEMRREATLRSDLAKSLFGEQLHTGAPSAFHAWLPMKRSTALQFAGAARALGIAVTDPLSVMVDPNDTRCGIRICLGGASMDEIHRALPVLAGIATKHLR